MGSDLDGRVAVITGACGNIGTATAQTLATAGATLALIDNRADRLEALEQDLLTHGIQVLPFTADVTNTNSMQQAAYRVHRQLGPASLLINSVDLMLSGPFLASTEQH